MKKILTKLAVAACFVSPLIVQASTIQIETGYSSAGSQLDAAAYKAIVDSIAKQSVSVSSYDNFLPQSFLATGESNFAFKSTVNFGVSAALAGVWEIRSGVDFGKGGAIFVDGVAKDFKTNDMWWAGSYSNPTQYFDVSLNLAAGNHVLQIYGLEGCCSGAHQAQFKASGGAGFTSFSSNDGLIAAVPEPETYAMLMAGLGLVLLRAWRRKRLPAK